MRKLQHTALHLSTLYRLTYLGAGHRHGAMAVKHLAHSLDDQIPHCHLRAGGGESDVGVRREQVRWDKGQCLESS